MNFIYQHYYTANRILLEIMGLWPYNNSVFVHIYRVILFTIFASSSVTQFAKLHSTIHDFDRFLYNLTYAVPSLIYILKFLTYIVYSNQVKQLIERIQHDWDIFKDEKEREIIRCNATSAMRYTIALYVMSFFALFGYVVMLYLPTFLDLVYPLNESRPKKLPILSEYFFLDEQDYYYPLLVHQSMVIALGITIVIVTETMNMVCIQHGCGLFEITSYRLKHVFDNEIFPSDLSDYEKYSIIHSKIIKAVMIHKRTIEFLDYFKSTFNPSYMILLILGVASITINLFRLLQAVTVMNDWEELMASGSFVLGQYGYMFTINYFGQKLNDRSFYVFKMTYEASWYTAPVQAQKFLILMQQKMIKGYILNINSLITASLETFASLTSMTLSYLTVIYSVR
ncbi:uncharacterized protein LOC105182721 [Harpegnathos saltator]|uniref:uncharacterized protein LOC105182721 n=1 Tax=Harpegnathos saltator TaxID=610380 RepID=UPI0009490492|nr:uncharacterized protein LOC105182721 [Harpegnathos saltator]